MVYSHLLVIQKIKKISECCIIYLFIHITCIAHGCQIVTWLHEPHICNHQYLLKFYWHYYHMTVTMLRSKFNFNDKLNLPQYCKRTFHIIISQCIQNIGDIHGWLYVTFWNLLLPYPHYNLSPSSSLTLFLNIFNLKIKINWQTYFTRICSPSKLHA